MLQEWLVRDGLTYPATAMEGGMPTYFTITGRAYPLTDTIKIKVGETLKVRFIGSNSSFIHSMHIHGGPFVVWHVTTRPLRLRPVSRRTQLMSVPNNATT